MVKIIKSNITARKISLVENEQKVTLFHQGTITCQGLYLEQHQSKMLTTSLSEKIILYVTQGNGELEVAQHSEQLHVQLLKDDVLLLPSGGSYQISNVSAQSCTLCVITIITQSP